MNFSLCSSCSELKSPCLEGLRYRTQNIRSTKPFACVGNFTIRNKLSDSDAKKVASCGQLVPGNLEGSSIGKRQLELPGRKLEVVRTLLIDNYDSYTYNIYQDLSIINGLPPVVVQNDDWTRKDVYHYLFEEKAFDNIVISPGPGTPTCPADIGICLELLLECWDIPILGVCLGHQALGYVHGAKIVHAPEPVHGRLSEIEHNGNSLFQDIPSGRNSGFKVVRYHSLVIDADSLPKEIVPIAWTYSTDTLSFLETQKTDVIQDAYGSQIRKNIFVDSFLPKTRSERSWPFSHTDKAERVLMGIRHSTRPHYGIQFHPESIATSHGRQIFKNFREMTEDYWLRLRSSFNDDVHYTECMQVPHASHAFGSPRSRLSVNKADDQLFRGTPRGRQLGCDADDMNSLGMFNRVSFSHPSTGAKFLKLNWRKLDCLATQVGGASNIFRELFGDHKAENTFWLDSSSIEKERARFSFMGGKSGSLWKQVTFRLSDQSDPDSKGGGYLSIEDAQGSTRSTFLKEGFFDFLNKELQSFHYEDKDFEGLPFNFYGGYIGYLGYNLKVECGMITNRHTSKTPDACFFFADNIVVIDHLNNDVYILSINDGNTVMPLWLEDTEQKLLRLKASVPRKLDDQTSEPASFPLRKSGFLADKSRRQYMEDVERCLKYIKDGESYELCFTSQLRKKIGEIDTLGLYFHLRQKNPAPYAAWLNFSNENLCICCSSPERFLQLDSYGTLEAKPIKGTIARGATREEDEKLKLQLQYSEKDQAENLMIVDLLRNDLGRVCEPGSVHVPRLMDVESYATVHTMVTTICGKKKSNISAIDCVKAAFPGGSMTGAPKLRSMELLDSLESCSRGIYSGSIGFFSYNQTFDLNIVIRTVVIHEGEASIGAGGAIVALSQPEDEYEEMLLKTRAPSNCVIEFESGSVPTK